MGKDDYLGFIGDIYDSYILISDEFTHDTLNPSSDYEFFVLALNAQTGELTNYIPFELIYDRWADMRSPIIEPNGDFYTFGTFHDAFDFNPFDGIVNFDTAVSNVGYNYRACLLKLTWDGTVGLEENQVLDQISVFPNPFQNQIKIEADTDLSAIKVMDLTGKIIDQISLQNAKSHTLETEEYSSGYYLVQLRTSLGEAYTVKITKQ